ncbi:hypothetical protein Tco_1013176 [Tanacetum coccineum]
MHLSQIVLRTLHEEFFKALLCLIKGFIWLLLKVVDFLHFLHSSTRPSDSLSVVCSSAIAFASSSSKYSWSESRLKLGGLNLSRLRVLKSLLDDQNSRSGSL